MLLPYAGPRLFSHLLGLLPCYNNHCAIAVATFICLGSPELGLKHGSTDLADYICLHDAAGFPPTLTGSHAQWPLVEPSLAALEGLKMRV